jgi:hypothetical protein
MTLIEFVKRECANWKHGRCLFGPCSVAEGKRCCVSRAVLTGGDPHTPDTDYFGACVAPLAKDRPEYADAADEYARLCGGKAKTHAKRFCECGAPLPRRARYCKSCSRKRCLAAKRATWAKTRQLTPFSPLQPVGG